MNKRLYKRIVELFIVIPLCVVGFFVWRFVDDAISYGHLEQNARARISGTELQQWATNLLAQSADGARLTPSKLGTNFPPQLLGLWHGHKDFPDIYLHCAQTNDTGETFPAWVQLIWGARGTGHSGLEIGPTNFIGRGRRWQDGVYFSPNR
ncbi:MAG: hypothetical protein JWM68_5780 [Verrucomicrobiales bacterium]|nr:hypothetical protein [Verrucomicrobiales bacterium]